MLNVEDLDYINSVNKTKNINEYQLLKKLISGDKTVRNKIIEYNLGNVVEIVKKYFYFVDHNFMDMVQAGNTGLIKAIDSYNGDYKNYRKYLFNCIFNEIKKELENSHKLIRVPANIYTLFLNYKRKIPKLEKEYKRKLTKKEKMDILNINVETLELIQQLNSNIISLSSSSVKKNKEYGVICNEDDIIENIEYQFLKKDINRVINLPMFNELERKILVNHIGLEDGIPKPFYKLEDISGLSRTTVKKIYDRSIKKLTYSKISNNILRDYY